MFLGDFPGYDEVALGRPFVGAAGGMHSRLLTRNGFARDAYRHEQVLRCCPPGGELPQAWAEAVAGHCQPYRQAGLHASPVTVAMGATAIRAALGLWQYDTQDVEVNNYHGTVHDRPDGGKVVCTFHPKYVQGGNVNLFGVVSFDLQVAQEVAAGTWTRDPIETVIDPPVEWFRTYIEEYEASLRDQPLLWLATDIETPDKEKGKAEDQLTEHDKSFQIDRTNFAYHPDQGITVPYAEGYIPLIHRLIAASRRVVGWNFEYDSKRLLARRSDTFHPDVQVLDGMWLAHHLRSSIPLGLGFWAPFYSNYGAWKHLFSTDPGTYAALDGPQELRTVRGVVQDLIDTGQWHYAHRHTTLLMQQVLKPASVIGIKTDRAALDQFEADLAKDMEWRLVRLQELVPLSLRQLTPKDGLSKPPTGPHPKSRLVNTRTGAALADAEDRDPLKIALYQRYARVVEQSVTRTIGVCRACGTEGVQARHRCVDKTLVPQVVQEARTVSRWFWQEPYNPDSPPQVLAYLTHYKHKPGKQKKTKKPTVDRDTLQRLWASTGHEFYELSLEMRSLGKVRGTYAIGVRKRLDAYQRFHSTFTLRPSTLRTSATAPNIQNVVSDRDANNLANGFRKCIIADQEPPTWTQDWTADQLAEYR